MTTASSSSTSHGVLIRLRSRNPYAAEVHFMFTLFSGSWNCLQCSEADINESCMHVV